MSRHRGSRLRRDRPETSTPEGPDGGQDVELSDFSASWTAIGVVVVAGAATYVGVIALTRIAGVRSLATMSSFDFAATVAVGSTLSSTLLGSVPLVLGLTGLMLLFALQYLIARLRRRGWLHGLADNRPILLMVGEEVFEDSLRHVRLSRDELMGQLRKAGVVHLRDVAAVVMETTGDVSVLHHGEEIDAALLRGVRGSEVLTRPGGGTGRAGSAAGRRS